MVQPKFFRWVIAALLTSFIVAPRAFAAPAPPHLSAKAAILIDGTTGQILWGRDIRGEFFPASITKIMTAYLAIKYGWNKVVVVSPQAALQPGASAYLRAGQRLPMPQVVTAMMLVSGNDAAYAVAQTVAGSVPKFVQMMNAQARAWGAPGIHFVNPDGLPNPGHVVSALGMAVIARHAMSNPTFARIVDTRTSTLPPDPHPRIYYNQNRLLYDFPGAVGVKIGYTIEADETIVAAARRHGFLLIEVLLHDTASGFWPDAANLLNWGFATFHPQTLIRRGRPLGALVMGGRRVPVAAAQGVDYALPDHAASKTTVKLRAARPRNRQMIRRGTVVGVGTVLLNGRPVAAVPVTTTTQVPAAPPIVHHQWWWMVLPTVVVASLLRRPRRTDTGDGRRMRHG